MNPFKKIICALALLFFIGGAYLYPQSQQRVSQAFGGAFTPIQAQKFTLNGSGVTSIATSVGVNSLLLPDAATKITMSMFGSIGYATIEPGTSKEENISFTGITQNANGTANLTGASRGLAFTTPYAASTTLAYAHAGGSYIIFSNSAPFYSQFGILGNAQTWGGVNTFSSTSQPVYDGAPTFTNGLALIDKTYADNLAIAGSPNAAVGVKGIVDIATGLQAASSSQAGVTSSIRVLPAGIATDTPNTATRGSVVLMSQIGGFLNQAWLDLTQAFTFASTTQYTANVGTLTATTSATLNNLSVTGTFSAPNSWTLLVATTTQQNMAYATTTFSANTYLKLVVYFSGSTNGNAAHDIYFNSDRTLSYGSQNSKFGTAAAYNSEQDASYINTNFATTSPIYFNGEIYNASASNKLMTWNQVGGVTTGPTQTTIGSGIWKNTSSQITQIVLTDAPGNGQINSGTVINVYGHN